jgi:hypothetical protein
MWAKLLQSLIISIVIPLLKDLAFAIVNAYKIRQIRKKIEAENDLRAEQYKKSEKAPEVQSTFENLP